ncbi:hypothetical protein [Undibacterium sp. TJN19]|uniref:hypothetical protein n=1 Tax=Undibacterium sp. TJN19 TaxID=3413055 RepID=UPI003BF26664
MSAALYGNVTALKPTAVLSLHSTLHASPEHRSRWQHAFHSPVKCIEDIGHLLVLNRGHTLAPAPFAPFPDYLGDFFLDGSCLVPAKPVEICRSFPYDFDVRCSHITTAGWNST